MAKEFLWHVPASTASPAEVKFAESTLEQAPRPEGRVIRLIADRAYDSDLLRQRLAASEADRCRRPGRRSGGQAQRE